MPQIKTLLAPSRQMEAGDISRFPARHKMFLFNGEPPIPIFSSGFEKNPSHNTAAVSLPLVLRGKERVPKGVRIVVLQSRLRVSDRKIEIH